MRWKTKALIQSAFSHVPKGEALNFLCQRRILRTLPVDDATFRETVGSARRHLDNLDRRGTIPLGDARFYEFGAGKDLIIPLAFYCLGVTDQLVVDIRPLARRELVLDSVRRLRDGVVPELRRAPDAALEHEDRDAMLAAVGISYQAPCDARATGLADGSVDYITSTSTLEHIPGTDIRSILRESLRILAPDGRLSLLVDYQDHYSYADRCISAYNFLQYEDPQWARWSPALQYQNRLRHSDYLAMYSEEGFEIVGDETVAGSPDDLEIIRRLNLATRFRRYAREDLAIRGALVTLKARIE